MMVREASGHVPRRHVNQGGIAEVFRLLSLTGMKAVFISEESGSSSDICRLAKENGYV